MRIEELIKYCEEVAESKRKQVENGDWEKGSLTERDCLECADEHKQLAKWLRDYKRLLERESALDKIRAEIGMYEADCRLQGGTDECEKCNSNVFGSIYRIIDKYKAESEEKE
jgi:hypothetical protein